VTADETKNNLTGDAAPDAAEGAAAKAAAGKSAETPQAAKTAKTDEPAAKPKRARAAKPKAAKAGAAAETPQADEIAATDEPAAKPKRARAAKPKAAKAGAAAETPQADEIAATDEPAAKPKRARAAKARAAKPKTAKADEAEAPPAKPRRRGKAAAPVAPARAERPPKPARAARAERPEPRRGAAGKATVVGIDGREIESRDLRPELFAVPADVGVLHLAVRGEQLARRRGTASTKTRGEISGSTAKLFRQKGTGRARAGSIKSPVRTGGGTAFGPKPRSYAIKVNRKVVKKALAMALSNRAENGHVFIAAGLELDDPSTKRVHEFLVGLDIAAPVLVVTNDEPAVTKSVRNLSYAETVEVRGLSTERVLRTRSLLLTEKAFAALSEA
jgi:large subunit ribosomal protein L4